MQKPDDIPQDIWDTADALVERLGSSAPLEEHETVVIARAILAERENAEARLITQQMHKEAKDILSPMPRKGWWDETVRYTAITVPRPTGIPKQEISANPYEVGTPEAPASGTHL